MITDIQKRNICRLSFDDKCTIVQEILENLGAVSVDEYAKIMDIHRRSVYHGITEKRIVVLPICNTKYPCINETLNQKP